MARGVEHRRDRPLVPRCEALTFQRVFLGVGAVDELVEIH